MKQKIKSYILTALALAVSTVPVIIATLSYFSVWKSRSSGAVLSGFTLLLLLLCVSPVFKFLKRIFQTASIPLIWLIIFILFAALRYIAEEVTVIAFVGFISNSIGAILFKAAGVRGKQI